MWMLCLLIVIEWTTPIYSELLCMWHLNFHQVSQSNLRDLLLQCCMDEASDVRQSAFALLGDLGRVRTWIDLLDCFPFAPSSLVGYSNFEPQRTPHKYVHACVSTSVWCVYSPLKSCSHYSYLFSNECSILCLPFGGGDCTRVVDCSVCHAHLQRHLHGWSFDVRQCLLIFFYCVYALFIFLWLGMPRSFATTFVRISYRCSKATGK